MIDWTILKKLAIQKLAERSTWLGLIALAGLLGFTIEPEWATWIVTTGVALGSMILIATNDVTNVNATLTLKVNTVDAKGTVLASTVETTKLDQ